MSAGASVRIIAGWAAAFRPVRFFLPLYGIDLLFLRWGCLFCLLLGVLPALGQQQPWTIRNYYDVSNGFGTGVVCCVGSLSSNAVAVWCTRNGDVVEVYRSMAVATGTVNVVAWVPSLSLTSASVSVDLEREAILQIGARLTDDLPVLEVYQRDPRFVWFSRGFVAVGVLALAGWGVRLVGRLAGVVGCVCVVCSASALTVQVSTAGRGATNYVGGWGSGEVCLFWVTNGTRGPWCYRFSRGGPYEVLRDGGDATVHLLWAGRRTGAGQSVRSLVVTNGWTVDVYMRDRSDNNGDTDSGNMNAFAMSVFFYRRLSWYWVVLY